MNRNRKGNRKSRRSITRIVKKSLQKRIVRIPVNKDRRLLQKRMDAEYQMDIAKDAMTKALKDTFVTVEISSKSLQENASLVKVIGDDLCQKFLEYLPAGLLNITGLTEPAVAYSVENITDPTELVEAAAYSSEKSTVIEEIEVDKATPLANPEIENKVAESPEKFHDAPGDDEKKGLNMGLKKEYTAQATKLRGRPSFFQFLMGNYRKQKQYTNPYSDDLEYFVKKVAPFNPEQVELLREFFAYPQEFEKCIHESIDNEGNITGYTITDEKEYHKQKKALGLG